MKDQAGGVVETTYDTAGRQTARRVTTLASGFDGAVRKIETSYTSRGQADAVTQYDSDTRTTVLNQVKHSYEDWGNLSKIVQDRDSIVGGGGALDYEVASNPPG